MSIFKRLDKMASRTNDTTNAEYFRLIPMTDRTNPNARRVADGVRVPVVGKGIFEYTSIEFGMELGVRKSYREANDLRNVSVGREPRISIDRSYFAGTDYEPRQGDVLIILDDNKEPVPDLPPFKVLDNQRDGLARFVLRLAQEGNQA